MTLQKKNLDSLYSGIKSVLDEARGSSFRAVNFFMVEAYWNIGRLIVEEEQKGKRRADYGSYLITELSSLLSKDFGKGFDASNLRNMRLFYVTFPISDALRHKSKKIN